MVVLLCFNDTIIELSWTHLLTFLSNFTSGGMHSIFLNPGNLIMSFIYKSQHLIPAALKCIKMFVESITYLLPKGFFPLKFHCLLIFNIGEKEI